MTNLTHLPDPTRSESWNFARSQHVNLVGYDNLVTMMNKSEQSRVQWVLPLHDDPRTQLVLSLEKWPLGEIMQIGIAMRTVSNGAFLYYGAIDPEGVLRPSSELRATDKAEKRLIWTVLQQLRDNPLRTLKGLGQETGICCMCNRELTDPVSVRFGIGPVCAERFGIVRQEVLDLNDFLKGGA